MANNPFESGARKMIPAVLLYARCGDEVLMLHRDGGRDGGRANDYHLGKWNGLGGKAELDESPLETAVREFAEESGVALPEERFRPLGSLLFPSFKPQKSEDWMVFVFEVDFPRERVGDVPKRCAEGALEWVPVSRLLELNLWEGDRHFIPLVVARRPFMGTIWYRDQRLARAWVRKV